MEEMLGHFPVTVLTQEIWRNKGSILYGSYMWVEDEGQDTSWMGTKQVRPCVLDKP